MNNQADFSSIPVRWYVVGLLAGFVFRPKFFSPAALLAAGLIPNPEAMMLEMRGCEPTACRVGGTWRANDMQACGRVRAH